MGSGLYGWGNDKEFVDWLKEHPNSEDDAMVVDVDTGKVIGESPLEDSNLAALVDDIVEEGIDFSVLNEGCLADLPEWEFEDVDDMIQVQDRVLAPVESTHRNTTRKIQSSYKQSISPTKSKFTPNVVEQGGELVGQVQRTRRAAKIHFTKYDNLRMGPYVVHEEFSGGLLSMQGVTKRGFVRFEIFQRSKNYRV